MGATSLTWAILKTREGRTLWIRLPHPVEDPPSEIVLPMPVKIRPEHLFKGVAILDPINYPTKDLRFVLNRRIQGNAYEYREVVGG